MNNSLLNIKITGELKIFTAFILIFSIIFRDNIELFKSKIIYYIIFLIFLLNNLIIKNNPGIIILFSSLFLLIWYDHNIKK
jgi:hypothetical protein